MSNARANYSCWLKKGDNMVTPSDNVEVLDQLEAGAYGVSYNWSRDQFTVTKKVIKTDGLVAMPQPETEEVMSGIREFYSQREEFARWDFVFKRGYLLYGVPGGGKTSIISSIINYVVEQLDGVVFVIYNEIELNDYARFMREVYRGVEPDRIIAVIFEDIDGMIKDETLLINVLDGLGNSNNVLNIATTNYTERLSERIINRPNRFDKRIEIKSPNYECREFFFKHKILPEELSKIDIPTWVKETEGMTLAQLSEIIKSVFLLKESFEEVISRLKGMKKTPQSTSYNKDIEGTGQPTGIGFQMGGRKPVKDETHQDGSKTVTYSDGSSVNVKISQ